MTSTQYSPGDIALLIAIVTMIIFLSIISCFMRLVLRDDEIRRQKFLQEFEAKLGKRKL
ncbi:hypothetical protein LINGRAHAP2_LOCUS14291 [Linum grandiflorum]